MSSHSGEQESEGTSERNREQTTALHNAVNATLNSYSEHRERGKINAVESLQEFWQMKLSQQHHVTSPISGLVTFEDEPEDRPPYVTYVTLPGGSCFGSFEHCQTKEDAKDSAAKVALMNSVLNEHPSRCVTAEFIDSVVKKAQDSEDELKNRPPGMDDPLKIVGAFQFMLLAVQGKSLLEFQELMTIFQLLNWNGTLSVLRDKGLSRQHVLSHYKSQTIDDDLREQMATDWVSQEQNTPESVARCYEQARGEVKEFCSKGRELRFVKEKRKILALALQQLDMAL